MLSVSNPMNREQFRLLREAKALIKQEFNEVVNLQEESILVLIYNFALESKDESLFEIHEQLLNMQDSKQDTPRAKKEINQSPSAKGINIGDIIDGQECVSFYRGSPVFKPV